MGQQPFNAAVLFVFGVAEHFLAASEFEPLIQPDGAEGLVKRKGGLARRRLKAA